MGFRKPTEFEVAEMLVLGSGAIENQERRGQTAFVSNDTTLPLQGSEAPEAKGSPIVWGDKVDNLFRKATLPSGWKKEASDHPMWSHLVDPKGCVRASIFYKGAFYDQESFIRFNVRYYARSEYHPEGDGMDFNVYDCGQGPEKVTIYSETPALPNRETEREAYFKAQDEAQARAKAWLVEHFPDHQNPNAYWDPPSE